MQRRSAKCATCISYVIFLYVFLFGELFYWFVSHCIWIVLYASIIVMLVLLQFWNSNNLSYFVFQVWKLGWSPKPAGDFGTVFPEIPVEFLQEKEIFKEFIYRINTLGMYRIKIECSWLLLSILPVLWS